MSDPTPLSLSDAAAAKFRALTAAEPTPSIGLRVYVTAGGCSGYRYGMMIEEQATPADQVFESNGVRVYLDGSSVPLVAGSTVDYIDTLMGAGFTLDNPNAVGGCGCGSSFRVAGSDGAPGGCGR